MPRAIRRSKILMEDNDVISPVAASSSVRSSTAAAGIGAGKTGHQEKGPSTPPARIAPASHGSSGRPSATSGARHFVARISSRAKSAPRIHFHLRRTYSGRPSSSMRFSDTTAMASSVVCRPSVRERSASHDHSLVAADIRLHQGTPIVTRCPLPATRPRSAISCRCRSRFVGAVSAVALRNRARTGRHNDRRIRMTLANLTVDIAAILRSFAGKRRNRSGNLLKQGTDLRASSTSWESARRR